jgi:GNAT superfamily N-acetyltransferase
VLCPTADNKQLVARAQGILQKKGEGVGRSSSGTGLESLNNESLMSPAITYRQGNLEDLSKLKFSSNMEVTAEKIEFNVVGMGHEFWIAVEGDTIVGLTVLARTTAAQRTILYLHVSDSRKNLGIGSALVRAILETYPQSEFSVIPFEGTEEFYRRLGFTSSSKWEMRKTPNPRL